MNEKSFTESKAKIVLKLLKETRFVFQIWKNNVRINQTLFLAKSSKIVNCSEMKCTCHIYNIDLFVWFKLFCYIKFAQTEEPKAKNLR